MPSRFLSRENFITSLMPNQTVNKVSRWWVFRWLKACICSYSSHFLTWSFRSEPASTHVRLLMYVALSTPTRFGTAKLSWTSQASSLWHNNDVQVRGISISGKSSIGCRFGKNSPFGIAFLGSGSTSGGGRVCVSSLVPSIPLCPRAAFFSGMKSLFCFRFVRGSHFNDSFNASNWSLGLLLYESPKETIRRGIWPRPDREVSKNCRCHATSLSVIIYLHFWTRSAGLAWMMRIRPKIEKNAKKRKRYTSLIFRTHSACNVCCKDAVFVQLERLDVKWMQKFSWEGWKVKEWWED